LYVDGAAVSGDIQVVLVGLQQVQGVGVETNLVARKCLLSSELENEKMSLAMNRTEELFEQQREWGH